MPKTLPDALRAPITDLASGKAWIKALVAADMAFHLEDDPGSIINFHTEERLFAKKDVPLIRARVASLYSMNWGPDPMYYCPIGYMMSVEPFNSENQAEGFEEGAEIEFQLGKAKIIDRAHCASYEYGEPGRYELFIGKTSKGRFNTLKSAERAIV